MLLPCPPGPQLTKNGISYFLYELVGLARCPCLGAPRGRMFIKPILAEHGGAAEMNENVRPVRSVSVLAPREAPPPLREAPPPPRPRPAPAPAARSSLHRTVLQTVLIHHILQQTQSTSGGVWVGVGLCVALFATEVTKVLFWALAWAINYRTAIRLKVATSTLVFENLVSFKTLTHVSVGEVSWPRGGLT